MFERIQMSFSIQAFLSSLEFNFNVVYLLSLSVMFIWIPGMFCLICFQLPNFRFAFFIDSQREFSYIILEYSVLFVLFNSVSISLESTFFAKYFLIYLFKLYS